MGRVDPVCRLLTPEGRPRLDKYGLIFDDVESHHVQVPAIQALVGLF